MKRTRLFLIVSVLLVTMLLSNNIILRNEKQESGDAMLASSFHSMNRISRGIDELLTITGQQETDYEMCEQRLVNISHEFMELHATLKTYASNFPSRKMQRSSYTSQTNDFEFIAGTLTSTYGEVNGYKFYGITEDNFISKKEIQYLVWLKESVDELKIDFFKVRLQKGDFILLCSDGLTNMIEDEEIRMLLLGQKDIVSKAETLVAAANRNGGKDNITVVLIEPFADEVNK